MKKLIFVLAFALLLTGCGLMKSTRIDEFEWEFSLALDESGAYAAYDSRRADESDELFEEAEEIDAALRASDGRMTLTADGRQHAGTYKELDMSGETRIYSVTLGKTEGMAVVAESEYFSDASRMTLVMDIGGYTLYFYGD